MSIYCPKCGEYHDETGHTCNPVKIANPELIRGSWQCGSCGTNYPPHVEKCECTKKLGNLVFRGGTS